MPAFDLVCTAGGTLQVWTDPASASPVRPSRLNTDPRYPPTYLRATPGDPIEFAAVVEGVEGPLDSNPVLDGRTFTWAWIEWSGNIAAPLVLTSGQSSVVSIPVTANHAGHHLLRCAMSGGGGVVAVPFDVET
jgi:hypothetical protein